MWNNSCYTSFVIVPVEWKIWLKTYSPENLLPSQISWQVSIYEYNIGIAQKYMTLFVICHHLYSFKNMRNTHGEVLLLVGKCPYSKVSVFSHIRTEYGEILSISPYSVRMRINTDQKNSEYGHISRIILLSWCGWQKRDFKVRKPSKEGRKVR